MAGLEEAIKTKGSKVWAMRRIADMKMVGKEEYIERAGHTAPTAQGEGDLHQLKDNLKISERRNNFADSRFLMINDECDSLQRQIASDRMCSGEMLQRLVNAFKDVDASIDDLSRHAARA